MLPLQGTAFVILIPVAEQCSSTARIGLYHCGHRTGAVLSSDEHWHTVLKHCLALLKSYDSCIAVSDLNGRSGVLVTVLGHCQALHYDPVTASVQDLYQCGKFRSRVCLSISLLTNSFYTCKFGVIETVRKNTTR